MAEMSKTGGVRIHVVFTSAGLMGESRIFPIYHPEVKIASNEQTLAELKARCEAVEFVGETAPLRAEEAVARVKEQKEALDGVVFFGSPPGELLSLGLPVVAVYPLWGQWMYPFHAYREGKVSTSFFSILPDRDKALFSSRLDEVVRKVGLIDALSRMKRLRVLVVTDRPMLGEYEPSGLQVGGDRQQYEEIYLHNLNETLGAELITVPQREMVHEMHRADEDEAEKIARRWVGEALAMKGTNEGEVVRSARLYLAMKELMRRHDCQAITTEGYTVFQYYEGGPIPSQGLPASQLFTDGIVATAETLVDSLLTQQLGLFITGSTGFNGDYLMDTVAGIAIIGHCECPFNPWGDERKVPYVIRNLPLWEEHKGGACVQVDLPIGEVVTVVKMSVHDRKIVLFTGETVSGEKLFDGWDDVLCRTKLAIRADTKKLFENLDWETFGDHRVVFYGDRRQTFRDLAALLGYEVIEDDR